MAKEGYKPTAGMQSAARRAIKLKEQGKAKGAGTAVGWTRAGQLARGETLSLSTVKRMYSFFSRHEVDKKGKDWDNAENPSNGKIMWLAWGGDAGFSWSRKIVEREKNMKKSLGISNDVVEEIKSIIEDVLEPFDRVIEIEDDLVEKSIDSQDEDESEYESDNEEEDKWDNMQKACWTGYKQEGMKEKNGRMVPNCVPIEKVEKSDQELMDITKALRPEVTREQLYAVVEALHEAIEAMLEVPEEDMEGEETETENPAPIGNEIEDVNNMANTWPVAKLDGQTDLEAERRNGTYEEEKEEVTKSLWSGIFK